MNNCWAPSIKANSTPMSGSIHERNTVLNSSHGIPDVLTASSEGSETTPNSSSDVSSRSFIRESTTSSSPKCTYCDSSSNSVSETSAISDMFIHVDTYERVVNYKCTIETVSFFYLSNGQALRAANIKRIKTKRIKTKRIIIMCAIYYCLSITNTIIFLEPRFG